MFEGEIPLGNLFEFFFKKGKALKKNLCSEPIDGVAYLNGNKLVYPVLSLNDKVITNIPSPYLSGILDEFIVSNQWVPLLETNRGCPFACTFCVWGISALDKVRVFPVDRCYEEIEYVAKKSPSPRWIFADANFGMLPRDLEIAKKIRKMHDKYKKLEMAQIWWAKNSSKHTLEISRIFGSLVEPMAAVQSMDMDVLKIIKRDNIKFETMTDLLDEWSKDNLSASTDVLVGLPGESLTSHLNTLRRVFDLGFSRVEVGNIRLLPGSEMETDMCRKSYQLKTKYRIISGGYGIYDETPVFEYEESVRSSKDITEEEMLSLRIIHFFIWAFWNLGIAKPILKYLQLELKQNPLDIILNFVKLTKDEKVKEFLNTFEEESRNEWFNSPEELSEYYNKNFEQLIKNGFLKLNFKYLAKILYDKEFTSVLINSLADQADGTLTRKLAQFCFERIYFPHSSDLVKEIAYDDDTIGIIKKIFPNISFASNVCKFQQSDKAKKAIEYELTKYGFHDNPIRALALTLETYKSRFLYDFQFSNKSVESEGGYTSSFDYHAQLGPMNS